uniref:Evolutionarily conserved signaling intermediate in Toll pathway, mitochondrial n=1 Tax=Rattus norvegicus TaxID=10116 RepID=A0A8I5ZQV7_RAT
MSWVQVNLLARGLSRGWGSICRTVLSGTPFAQPSLQARGLHCSAVTHKDDVWLVPRPSEPQKKPIKVPAMHEDLFRPSGNGEQDKASFLNAVRSFGEHNVRKRGHVDFIYLALRKMPEFGVERDLSVYNLLLDVFPKEVFRPRNAIQRIFVHYPRQQECGVAVLEQMERHGEGSGPSLPFTPCSTHLCQSPKSFVGDTQPCSSLQMSLPSESTGIEDPTQPHIVGIQSPDQQAALARHNPSRPVFVEGPFPLWLRNKCVYYHILRADLPPPEEETVEEIPEEWNLYYPMQLDLEYSRSAWDNYEFDMDEVTEGPVFAMCMTGAHDQATLVKWIQGLQETNPTLAQIPVVFRLARSTGELLATTRLEGQSPPHSPPKGPEEDDEAIQAQQRQGQS